MVSTIHAGMRWDLYAVATKVTSLSGGDTGHQLWLRCGRCVIAEHDLSVARAGARYNWWNPAGTMSPHEAVLLASAKEEQGSP